MSFDFKKVGDVYEFTTNLVENQLKLVVTALENGDLEARIYDCEFGDEYTLHLVEGAEGTLI